MYQTKFHFFLFYVLYTPRNKFVLYVYVCTTFVYTTQLIVKPNPIWNGLVTSLLATMRGIEYDISIRAIWLNEIDMPPPTDTRGAPNRPDKGKALFSAPPAPP